MSIRSKADRNLNGNEVKQIAPGFFWLLRDALLKPTDRSGQPCNFKDFLLEKVDKLLPEHYVVHE